MTDTATALALEIDEPVGKGIYLCVTSSMAGLPLGSLIKANGRIGTEYVFTEEITASNHVRGEFRLPVVWFSEVTSDENVAVAILKLKDEFKNVQDSHDKDIEALNTKHTNDVKALNKSIADLKIEIDNKSSPYIYKSWKINTELKVGDLFVLSEGNVITPAKNKVLVWRRINPTTNKEEYKEVGAEGYGFNRPWDTVTIIDTLNPDTNPPATVRLRGKAVESGDPKEFDVYVTF